MSAFKQTMRLTTRNANPTIKKPSDVYKKCPECACAKLLKVDGDVICVSCDWNSIAAYADALFNQNIGILFESEEAKEKRREEKCRKDEERTRRVMESLCGDVRAVVLV